MSVELRERFKQYVHQQIFGEDGQSGVAATVLSGGCKDYAVYRDMCGYIRGLRTAEVLMGHAWSDTYGPLDVTNPENKSDG